MEVLVFILLQLAELLFEGIGSGLLDLLIDLIPESKYSGWWLLVVLSMGAGIGLGWLSLIVVPHSLIPLPALRVLNLVVGPLFAGWLSWRFAWWRQQRGKAIKPLTHGLVAALICIGIVVTRFIGVEHPAA